MHLDANMGEQAALFSCKAHIFKVDPDTRKSWVPLSTESVNVQIFHDSVKNFYRILSVDGSKVLLNTIVTSRMNFTKTSQKFCQWVDTKANQVYGLGFASENELNAFMEKFIEVKEATKIANRNSGTEIRQTNRSEADWSIGSGGLDQLTQLKQENEQLKLALTQNSNNGKKWQEELETLRSNNAKLTTALQESHGNVEEWKRQLHFYRDECTRLRQMVSSQHSHSSGRINETEELKRLLEKAEQRNQEQEQKLIQLENQTQRYINQLSALKDRLSERENINQNLRTDVSRRTPQHLSSNRTVSTSPYRSYEDLVRLRDAFQTKTNDFNQTLNNKMHDLQKLLSQITQIMTEI